MKCLMKNLIILFALIFLALFFLGRTAYKSYMEGSKVHKQEEVKLNKDKGNKNFEILEVPSEEKKQMEESLGYEISEIKYIKFFEGEKYREQEVKNKEGYKIEDISEVKNVVEFSGDHYQSICDNKKNEEVTVKLGEKKFKNDYMVDFPLDAKIISNALGFDVKREILIDLNLDVKVEGKTFATVSLYPEINSYDFKIVNKDGNTSKGRAKKVCGAYLIVRKDKINES